MKPIYGLFIPGDAPLENDVKVVSNGDEYGVMIAFEGEERTWECFLNTADARAFIYQLHRTVMVAAEAEVQSESA